MFQPKKNILFCINYLISFVLVEKAMAESIQPDIPPSISQSQQFEGSGIQRVGSASTPSWAQSNETTNSQQMQQRGSLNANQSGLSLKKLPYDTIYIPSRIIYLNGININSVKNQELENVNIRIDKNGNIYIDAPQYEASSEQSYHPLMPIELPRHQKVDSQNMPVPKGVYSKETGKFSQDAQSPVLPKEFSLSSPNNSQSENQPPNYKSAQKTEFNNEPSSPTQLKQNPSTNPSNEIQQNIPKQ